MFSSVIGEEEKDGHWVAEEKEVVFSSVIRSLGWVGRSSALGGRVQLCH